MSTSYSHVIKTTFLFGFVQIFKAVITIIKNKIAAILIGPEGIGLIGIFGSVIDLIKTGAGLGVAQSAVRDLSEANASNQKTWFSRVLVVTNRVILFTGLLGCLITLILSRNLSYWTMGDSVHIVSYCVLSLAVGFNIVNDGKIAILKGTRQLRSLAFSGVLGSIISIVTALPLFYFFGKDGIVPELLIASILGLIATEYFVRKIPYDKISLSLKDTYGYAQPMLKMGCALMYVSLLQFLTTFIINAFVRSKGGLEEVGFFNVGATILNAYFGLVVTAISTDYFPRISAVNKNNIKIQEELNQQSIVSILLIGPMFVVLTAFLPFWIRFLYSNEFLPAIDYIKYAIYWSFITTCSNQVDMILVAKFETKIMALLATLTRLVQLLLVFILYSYWGLTGLGVTFAFLGVFHLVVMSGVVYKKYGILFNKTFIKIAFISLLLSVLSTLNIEFVNEGMKIYGGVFLCMLSFSFSYFVITRVLKLNILSYLSKFKK